jgi:hypothetical protein
VWPVAGKHVVFGKIVEGLECLHLIGVFVSLSVLNVVGEVDSECYIH